MAERRRDQSRQHLLAALAKFGLVLLALRLFAYPDSQAALLPAAVIAGLSYALDLWLPMDAAGYARALYDAALATGMLWLLQFVLPPPRVTATQGLLVMLALVVGELVYHRMLGILLGNVETKV